jgi:sulfide:quinone oxidoreductase
MSKIIILGTGISGYVTAPHLRRKLSKEHEFVVVSLKSNY